MHSYKHLARTRPRCVDLLQPKYFRWAVARAYDRFQATPFGVVAFSRTKKRLTSEQIRFALLWCFGVLGFQPVPSEWTPVPLPT